MARTKQTKVKYSQGYPRATFPRGKVPPGKVPSQHLISNAAAEAQRQKDAIQDMFGKLPKINIPGGIVPKRTKTKASLKSALKSRVDQRKRQNQRKTALTKLSEERKKSKVDKFRSYMPMLESIAKKKKGYKFLIANPTNDMVTIFCKCARNLLKGNAKLSSYQMQLLAQDKENVRKLAKPNTALTTKKKIIQKGGFLPLLAAGALGALAPTLLGGLFGGR